MLNMFQTKLNEMSDSEKINLLKTYAPDTLKVLINQLIDDVFKLNTEDERIELKSDFYQSLGIK